MNSIFRGGNIYIVPPIIYTISFAVMVFTAFISVGANDIIWLLNLDGIYIGSVRSIDLFTIVYWFMASILLDRASSLIISKYIAFMSLLAPLYLFKKDISGDRGFIISSLLIIVYPYLYSLLTISRYDVLLGIVLNALTIYYLKIYLDGDVSSLNIMYIAFLSLLVGLTDYLSGVITFLTILLYYIYSRMGNGLISVKGIYVLASLPALSGFIFSGYRAVLTIDFNVLTPPFIILLVLGITGLYMIYRDKGVIPSIYLFWLAASTSITWLSIGPVGLPIYIIYPLFIPLSYLVLNGLKGLYKVVYEGGEDVIEIDLGGVKLPTLILVALLIFSGISQSYVVADQVARYNQFVTERYGADALLDVVNWIKFNTPEDAKILVEYPLSTWISLYTGREVITDYNPFGDDNFDLASYEASSMLNSNYEVRNAYIRIWDWSPVAPQRTPLISSSDGRSYIDFIYIDENNARVTYIDGGRVVSPDFYSYLSANSTWVERSSDRVVLMHRYVLSGGVLITKYITLDKDPKVNIKYIITSNQSNILNFLIKLWIPWERRVGVTEIRGSSFYFTLDSGEYRIDFGGDLKSIDFRPDEKWAQQRVSALYQPDGDNTIEVDIDIIVLNAREISWAGDGVVSYSIDELLSKNGVSYAVIPTILKKELMDRFGLDYKHFKHVYENSKLTVYKVTIELEG